MFFAYKAGRDALAAFLSPSLLIAPLPITGLFVDNFIHSMLDENNKCNQNH